MHGGEGGFRAIHAEARRCDGPLQLKVQVLLRLRHDDVDHVVQRKRTGNELPQPHLSTGKPHSGTLQKKKEHTHTRPYPHIRHARTHARTHSQHGTIGHADIDVYLLLCAVPNNVRIHGHLSSYSKLHFTAQHLFKIY